MLLAEKLKAYRLILASASPRRRQVLVGCGRPFVQAEPYDVSETYPAGMPAGEVPVSLARLKSDAYPLPLASFDILVTADTVVAVDDRILGKPADRGVAVAMLRALSGRRHRVVTGVTIRTADRAVSFSSSTDVFLRSLSDEEIGHYVDTYAPYDKAGSYGIQEWIGYVGIERIEGSFYNVMGLPVQRLYVELDELIG